jgi:hypothetical protein
MRRHALRKAAPKPSCLGQVDSWSTETPESQTLRSCGNCYTFAEAEAIGPLMQGWARYRRHALQTSHSCTALCTLNQMPHACQHNATCMRHFSMHMCTSISRHMYVHAQSPTRAAAAAHGHAKAGAHTSAGLQHKTSKPRTHLWH